MTTAIHRLVESARRGENPTVICRMSSGWLVLADKQVLRGYCLLLPDPVVSDLNALPDQVRDQFLRDMSMAGDALLRVTSAARINYEILGNLEPALHAHILPRYDDEAEATRTKPVWFHDWESAAVFSPAEHQELIDAICRELGV